MHFVDYGKCNAVSNLYESYSMIVTVTGQPLDSGQTTSTIDTICWLTCSQRKIVKKYTKILRKP